MEQCQQNPQADMKPWNPDWFSFRDFDLIWFDGLCLWNNPARFSLKRDEDMWRSGSCVFWCFRSGMVPLLFWITLPETNSSPLKIGNPKRKLVHIPTIHFQVLLLLVSGRVSLFGELWTAPTWLFILSIPSIHGWRHQSFELDHVKSHSRLVFCFFFWFTEASSEASKQKDGYRVTQ